MSTEPLPPFMSGKTSELDQQLYNTTTAQMGCNVHAWDFKHIQPNPRDVQVLRGYKGVWKDGKKCLDSGRCQIRSLGERGPHDRGFRTIRQDSADGSPTSSRLLTAG